MINPVTAMIIARVRAVRSATSSPRRRPGFSLVEVIVAIALFGIAMSAIAALTLAVTRQSADTSGTVERTAALEARVNDVSALPFVDLDGRAGCTTITTPPLPRQECIAISNVSTTRKRVVVTITPADSSIDAVSVGLERTKPPPLNPFRAIP
jgi:prepilin-type N-terminal cleavage/methylation domain-containing protein